MTWHLRQVASFGVFKLDPYSVLGCQMPPKYVAIPLSQT